MKKLKIVIISPTYNESENIDKLVKVLFNAFPRGEKYEFHLLIVDGDSPDGTADLVRRLIPKFSRLHILVEREKNGLGAAYIMGMDYAFDKMNADYVFEFDADLSHDATKIREFVEKIEEGYDLVLGTRYRNGGSIPKNWGFHRKILSILGNYFTRLIFFDSRISDWTGGFKALSKNVYRAVKGSVSLEKGYTFQISLNKAALDRNFNVAEVPFNFKDREAGQSKLGAEYLFNALTFVIKTRIKDLISLTLFRVAIVGGIGSVVQLVFFTIFFKFLNIFHLLSVLLSIECAIISNFILNNNFSFKRNKILKGNGLLKGFFKFNSLSAGSVIVQMLINSIGIRFLGDSTLVVYTLLVFGILVGLISNFYFYKNFVWKAGKKN